MRIGILIAIAAALAVPSIVASRELERAEQRQVVRLGCRLTDATCWIVITGESVGPTDCESNTIRWLASNPGAREVLSLLMSAHLTQKSLNIEVEGNCLEFDGTSSPTLRSAESTY